MKYKWKDKVRIKSKKELECISEVTYDMLKNGGKIMTIACLVEDADGYIMKEDGDFHFLWSDEMIEGLVEEESANYSKLIDNGVSNPIIAKTSSATIDTDKGFYSYSSDGNLEMEWNLPQGYQFKDENGNVINATKIVLEKKKTKYPKTYEECCKVLGVNSDNFLSIRNLYRDDGDEESTDYERDLLGKFDSLWELIICRDAYWKIAGEEMGLGKPWEPDWSIYEHKFCLGTDKDKVIEECVTTGNRILAFPTKEMRDAFKEYFDSDIEICKEFL